MNVMIVLTRWLFGSFGLAIIAFTIIMKVVLYPVQAKQMKSTKAMQDIQPKLAELQRKYARDSKRLAQEQMALYKEMGMNPAGCLLPMFIQLPIWIALYQSITKVLAVFPEDLLQLSQYLYSWSIVFSKLPLEKGFAWLDLAIPDGFYIMPLLTGVTMWIQQKMTMVETSDSQTQQTNNTMLWTMPIMFTIFTFSFPSGLALYWVISNIISIVMQYFMSGWGGLATLFQKKQLALPRPIKPASTPRTGIETKESAVTAPPEAASTTAAAEEGLSDEQSGDKRKDSRRGSPKSPAAPRPRPRRGKGNRPKGR